MAATRLLAAMLGDSAPVRGADAPALLLTGYAALATLLTALSLVFPLGLAVHGAVVCGLLLYAYLDRRRVLAICREQWARARALPWPLVLAAVLLFAFAALRASGWVTYYDSGEYHVPAVRWAREFPAVPGLANLNSRLGTNSSWFVYAAFIEQGWLVGRSAHVAPLVIWTVALLVMLQGAHRLRRGRGQPSDWLRLGMAAPLIHHRALLASLSPDLATSVLVLCAAVLTADLVQLRDVPATDERAARARLVALQLTLLSLAAIATKLSATVAPLFAAAALWLWRRQLARRGWCLAALCAAVLIPYLARNVILSGYLLYPVAAIDLFAVDWKLPRAAVVEAQQYVHGFAIFNDLVCRQLARQSIREWFVPWFRWHLRVAAFCMALFALGPLAGLCLTAAVRGAGRLAARAWLPLQGAALCGVLLWLVSAPDPRFGFVWLWLAATLPLAVLCRQWRWLRAQQGRVALAVAFGLAAALWAPPGRTGAMLLGVRPLPAPPLHPVCRDGLVIWAPDQPNDCQVWDERFPASNHADAGLHPRGPRLRDGFRRTAPPREDWRD